MSETLTAPAPAQTTLPFGYPTEAQALAVSPVTPGCVPQDHLEPVLRDHLVEHGGSVRFETELTALATDPSGVRAELLDRRTGRRSQVRSRYLIGADGPRSAVRSALGIEVEDLGTLGQFVSVTFRADLTRRLPRVPSAINTVQAAGAEGHYVPTSADDRWIFAREWRPESGERLAEWTPARITDVLRTGTGLADLDPTILAVMPFDMGGHVATTFRVGSAFLIGDAAHRTTPVGGTGMNTAIHGAHNLGWKLAWVLRGWADESLLDSYQPERRPIGIANVRRSLERGPQPPADGLSWDIGVRYESPVIASGLGIGTGQRAPHVWVRHRGRRVSTVDLFDGRLSVIIGSAGSGWRRAAAEIGGEGLPIVAPSADVDLCDDSPGSGMLADHYHLGTTGAALIRPDGYIAWHRGTVADRPLEALRAAVDVALGRRGDVGRLPRAA